MVEQVEFVSAFVVGGDGLVIFRRGPQAFDGPVGQRDLIDHRRQRRMRGRPVPVGLLGRFGDRILNLFSMLGFVFIRHWKDSCEMQ